MLLESGNDFYLIEDTESINQADISTMTVSAQCWAACFLNVEMATVIIFINLTTKMIRFFTWTDIKLSRRIAIRI